MPTCACQFGLPWLRLLKGIKLIKHCLKGSVIFDMTDQVGNVVPLSATPWPVDVYYDAWGHPLHIAAVSASHESTMLFQGNASGMPVQNVLLDTGAAGQFVSADCVESAGWLPQQLHVPAACQWDCSTAHRQV